MITFDAKSSNRTTSGTTNTVSHTCSGSNRLLLVAVECQNGDLITGVTYNGVAMTQLGKNNISAFGFYNYWYYLVAPATGANNIVVTASGSCTMLQCAESLNGVDQTTPIENDNKVNQTSATTNPTGTVTTVSHNAWIVGSCRVSNFQPTATSPTIQRNTTGADVGYNIYDLDNIAGLQGTKTLNTTSSSQTWYFWTLAIKPSERSTRLEAGLVGYWNLRSNSNANFGSINGTDSSISYTASSTIGNAAEFNGSSSQINFGNSAKLTLATAGSISLWAETDITSGYRLILNKGAINSSYMILQDADYSPVRITGRNATSASVTNTSGMSADTGYHIVYTFTNTPSLSAKLYINGTEVASTTSGTLSSAVSDLILGFCSSGGGGSNRWDGHINRFGLWDRILTSAEVTALYSSGAGLEYPFTGAGEYLIVAGGGGGGGDVNGGGRGGGGAGGVIQDSMILTAGSYTVTVGAGGNGATSLQNNATNGGNSSFNSRTATGGGYGGSETTNGQTGGSGGGAGYASGSTAGSGTTGQGFGGGDATGTGSTYPASGGGGASQAGTAASTNTAAGKGGDGIYDGITGSLVAYGGGGGGGCRTGATAGAGGLGGGGAGTGTTNGNGTNGTANTGGGGGGSEGSGVSGNGGSGVVIVKYKTADWGTCTGGTKTTDGDMTIHTFTSSGTLTMVSSGGGGSTFIPVIITS